MDSALYARKIAFIEIGKRNFSSIFSSDYFIVDLLFSNHEIR